MPAPGPGKRLIGIDDVLDALTDLVEAPDLKPEAHPLHGPERVREHRKGRTLDPFKEQGLVPAPLFLRYPVCYFGDLKLGINLGLDPDQFAVFFKYSYEIPQIIVCHRRSNCSGIRRVLQSKTP